MVFMFHFRAYRGWMVYCMSSRRQRARIHVTVVVPRHAHVHRVIRLRDIIDQRLGVLTRQHVCLVILAFCYQISVTPKLEIFDRFTCSW